MRLAKRSSTEVTGRSGAEANPETENYPLRGLSDADVIANAAKISGLKEGPEEGHMTEAASRAALVEFAPRSLKHFLFLEEEYSAALIREMARNNKLREKTSKMKSTDFRSSITVNSILRSTTKLCVRFLVKKTQEFRQCVKLLMNRGAVVLQFYDNAMARSSKASM